MKIFKFNDDFNFVKVNDIKDPGVLYPGKVLIIPHKKGPKLNVNGYIYNLKEQAASIIEKDGKDLTYVSPFAYRIKEDGSLQSIDDIQAIKSAYTEKAVPIMAITNFTSTALGENLASVVLNSTQIIERLLANIITIMKEKGYHDSGEMKIR